MTLRDQLTLPPEALDALAKLRQSHGSGGPNFTPDIAARNWNEGVLAAADALGFGEQVRARFAADLTAQETRTQAALDRVNARCSDCGHIQHDHRRGVCVVNGCQCLVFVEAA